MSSFCHIIPSMASLSPFVSKTKTPPPQSADEVSLFWLMQNNKKNNQKIDSLGYKKKPKFSGFCINRRERIKISWRRIMPCKPTTPTKIFSIITELQEEEMGGAEYIYISRVICRGFI
ncbi:unnamed protein product [Brassica rapa]|uniref:Uncharacterized protein n=1 Tax=Brassica campestris TaxID=3711 RepID=A0A8D9GCR2_BRACM|nr:unnamed protein product [Brassica rapa]